MKTSTVVTQQTPVSPVNLHNPQRHLNMKHDLHLWKKPQSKPPAQYRWNPLLRKYILALNQFSDAMLWQYLSQAKSLDFCLTPHPPASYGGVFSTEVPCSQMTLAYVKLTWERGRTQQMTALFAFGVWVHLVFLRVFTWLCILPLLSISCVDSDELGSLSGPWSAIVKWL